MQYGYAYHISQFVWDYHLPTNGAGFPESHVAIVAALQVNTNFLSDKHLETVHGLREKGNIQLVVIRVPIIVFSFFVFRKAR